MSRILLIWELGGGFGHYSTLRPLAIELKARGHDIYFAVQDLSRSEYMLDIKDFHVMQAPLWLRVPAHTSMHSTSNYTDILMKFGYTDVIGLTGLVKAWRNMLELVQPDLVIVNHAPTALLAMRGLNFPVVSVGHGFFLPPKLSPLPTFTWWEKGDTNKLKAAEKKVLTVINAVLNKLEVQPVKQLSDIFYSAHNILCTFEELDHYKEYRDDVTYWGPLFEVDEGIKPEWPVDTKKKIFVYLSAKYVNLASLLTNLSRLPYHYLVYIPGLKPEHIENIKRDRFTFLKGPAQVSLATRMADAAVTHGGIGTTLQFALAGVPLLLVPRQMEQYLFCKRLVEFGSAILTEPNVANPHHDVFLKKLIENRKYRNKAVEFSAKYADFSINTQVQRICDRCETFLENELVPE